jgi:hypothetical protein
MVTLDSLNQHQLEELWQHPQSLTDEETRACGDVVLLWHLAERLNLVNILDEASGKRVQGQSVDLLTVLIAIHRDVAPSRSLRF